jgi:hypothetical protein
MDRKPKAFEKLSWRFSSTGKARLALSEEVGLDSAQARQRLQEALALLDDPHTAQDPEARELLPQVLERLAQRTLELDPFEAAGIIDRLSVVAPGKRAAVQLRWTLIQKLIPAKDGRAVRQAGAYVCEPAAEPACVVDLLTWALQHTTPDSARSLAGMVYTGFMNYPAIQTLVYLCLQPECPADRKYATQMAHDLAPSALTNADDLRFKAHLLRAQCCEAAGDWMQMAEEAGQAVRLNLDPDPANYWRARALLHLNDPQTAAQVLSRRPLTGLSPWMRLTHIAALQSEPDLTRVEPCLQVLEGKWGSPDAVEKDLAVQAIETSLQPSFAPSIEQVKEIAAFSDRLIRLVGARPFLQLNLALKELRVDAKYESVLARLARGNFQDTPWAALAVLIQCACALILGRYLEFTRFVDKLERLPDAGNVEKQFFQVMQAVIVGWKTRSPERLPEDLLAMLDLNETTVYFPDPHSTGSLFQALPLLSTLAGFVRSLESRAECLPPSAYASLAGCAWAQWLWFRTWARSLTDPAELLEFLDQTGARSPALDWDALVLRQECLAGLPAETGRRTSESVAESLLEYKAEMASLPVTWQELVSMRAAQAGQTIGTLQQIRPQDSPGGTAGTACPWWLENHWLQSLTQADGETESLYLHGRLALRQGSPAQALEYFDAAQKKLDAEPRTASLSLVAGCLPYWQGAALAGLGRSKAAYARFEACQPGLKANEALVQQALLGIAQLSLPAAQNILDSLLPDRSFPALSYLRALAAVRLGQPQLALKHLDELAECAGRSPAYFKAGLNLRASLVEQSGDQAAGAAADDNAAGLAYRAVLDQAPGDPVAAVRLARLWARRKYRTFQQGEPFNLPAPSIAWKPVRARIAWAAALQELCEVLAAGERSAPAQKRSTRKTSATPALQRLSLRIRLQNRKPGDTLTLPSALSETTEDAGLASLVHLMALEKALAACLNDRSDENLAELKALLAGFADPVEPADSRDAALFSSEFWRESARQVAELPGVLSPAWEALLTDETCPASQRAWIAAWGLFSQDARQRQDAATALSAIAGHLQLSNQNVPAEPLRAALLALAAHVQGDDVLFLEQYAQLESRLTGPLALPCSAAELYLLAGQARLRTRQPEAVLDAPCPPDLSPQDPRRVELLNLAHLQRAALHALNDPALAMEEVKKLTVDSSS